MFIFTALFFAFVIGSLRADVDTCKQNAAAICEPGLVPPTSKEKMVEFCESVKRRSSCYLRIVEACDDTDDLRYRQREYDFLSKNCKQGASFFENLANNLDCVNNVSKQLQNECSLEMEDNALIFLTYIMELDIRHISAVKDNDDSLECLEYIYDLACLTAIYDKKCGSDAGAALLDLGRNMNLDMMRNCHQDIIDDMPTLVRAFETFENEDK